MNINCPIIQNKKIKKFFTFKDFPIQTTPIDKKNIKKLFVKFGKKKLFTNLEYCYCKKCDHIFLKKSPNQKLIDYLYKNFYNYPSPLLNEISPDRDNLFLKVFYKFFHKKLLKLKNKNLLEIGCSDGYILYNLRKYYNVVGIDPSKGAEIGKKFGLNIKRKFFSYNNFKKDTGKYSIILARHFLEHLSKPKFFLDTCYKILQKNGYIIIEVPNVTHFIRNGLVEIFSPQHIQCFSKLSIKKILFSSGFYASRILEINGNLIVFARKDKTKKKIANNTNIKLVKNFKKKFHNLEIKLKNKIEKKYKKNNILLWGAGSFCLSFLNTFDINFKTIKYVIDSNKKKTKLKFINSNLKIISPNNAKKFKPNLIIITSYYSENIINMIKKMHFTCEVLTIFPKYKCLKIN